MTVAEFVLQTTDDAVISFLKEIQHADLARVMHEMDEAAQNRIYAVLSGKAAEMLKDEIEQLSADRDAICKSTEIALAIIAKIET